MSYRSNGLKDLMPKISKLASNYGETAHLFE